MIEGQICLVRKHVNVAEMINYLEMLALINPDIGSVWVESLASLASLGLVLVIMVQWVVCDNPWGRLVVRYHQ